MTDDKQPQADEDVEEVLRKHGLPYIEVKDVPLRSSGQQALAALTKANRKIGEKTGLPRLYVRGGVPVRIKYDERGALVIQDVDWIIIQRELTHAAEFLAAKGKDMEMLSPPQDVCRYVLSALQWTFPPLAGVTAVPVFRPDGTILTERGYDAETQLIYDPPTGFEVVVPDRVTKADVKKAKALISEVIGDFPYENRASLANTMALALTPVLREVIDGPVPMAAIDKPTPGTGASLLVDSLAYITSGSEPGALGAVENDDEMRKAITSKLRTGARWLFLDNVNVELKSASLARALTARVWEDRILGVSRTLSVPVKSTWVCTANNLELSGEIARRCYRIRLDSKRAKPWERPTDQFTIPNLAGWIRENRAEVLGAFMTIARNWFVKGKPEAKDVPTMGSFEEWSKVVGGVLEAADIDGFLGNSNQLYERASEEVGMWAAFLEVCRSTYGTGGVTSQTIAGDIQVHDKEDLQEALPHEFSVTDDNLARKLGRAFGKREGVRYGDDGLYVARAGDRQRAILWTVRSLEDDVAAGGATDDAAKL